MQEIKVGQFVRIPGNADAWNTGFILNIVNGKALIGYGSRNTSHNMLRLGCEMPIPINQLEVI